jgi:hypothetical protein
MPVCPSALKVREPQPRREESAVCGRPVQPVMKSAYQSPVSVRATASAWLAFGMAETSFGTEMEPL